MRTDGVIPADRIIECSKANARPLIAGWRRARSCSKRSRFQHYARQAKNFEAERQCEKITLRAEREWGLRYRNGQKAKCDPAWKNAPLRRGIGVQD